MTWNPAQYLKFAEHRLRPAIDLLNRVEAEAPRLIYDLGCGAGNVTRLLRLRWPLARIVGVDSSAEMLEQARATLPDVEWVQADLATWRAEHPADVIYSNAALQWLGDHPRLFPALLGSLSRSGILAVQMPRNHGAPSHTGMAEAARSGPWRARLEPLLRESPVQPPAVYWELLGGQGAACDLWEAEYLQALEGEDAVLQWTLGTALKPLLDALDGAERELFLADYRRRMATAYPRGRNGVTLFPFRRLFMIARRNGAE
ncbi:MAG TPA: methyltransferase domain-containing protein [Patescibacteria group bacterium]|nr:methyltransferase domain-containing protein [Patescibacteria group bacterium]